MHGSVSFGFRAQAARSDRIGSHATAGAGGGPNVIRTEQIRTVFHIIAETLREPTFVLLLVAGGLYLVLGSLGEGLFVCAGAVVSLGMVILQETRSERALQALQALAEPEARVIRDGRQRRIPSPGARSGRHHADNGG